MARTKLVVDLSTGNQAEVPYTPQEEAAADAAYAEWLAEQEAIVPVLTPTLRCLANLHLDAGEVSGIETAKGLIMAFMIDVGKLWVFFETPMADTTYGWNVGSTSGGAIVTDRQTDYLEITVSDTTEPFDVSLQIFALV